MMLATLLSLVLSTVQWERDTLVADAAAAGLTLPAPGRGPAGHHRDHPRRPDRHGPRRQGAAAQPRGPSLARGLPGRRPGGLDARSPRRRVAAATAGRCPSGSGPRRRALDGETVRGLVVEADDLGTGQPRLVSVDAVPLHDSVTGQPDRALLVLRDVTDENRRLDDVEAAHARTERLIADAPHGVAVLDMRGRILQVNSSLAASPAAPSTSLVGRSFDDLAPDNRDEIAEHLHRAVLIARVAGRGGVDRARPGPRRGARRPDQPGHLGPGRRGRRHPGQRRRPVRAAALRAAARAPRRPRRAHRPAQPPPVRRRARRAPRPVRPLRPARRPAAARPRPLQGGQRHPRPRRR